MLVRSLSRVSLNRAAPATLLSRTAHVPRYVCQARRAEKVDSRDLYRILEVSQDATLVDIKRSYRRLARMYHPDVSTDSKSAARFQEIAEAWETLSDARKRAIYDKFGNLENAYQAGPSAVPEDGKDLQVWCNVDFMAAVKGGTADVVVRRQRGCHMCTTTGVRPGSKMETCMVCWSTGRTTVTQDSAEFGDLDTSGACPNCGGVGEMPREFCRDCGGLGYTKRREMVKIKIPPGINTGSCLKVREQGDAGRNGGKMGDLYVYLKLRDVEDVEWKRVGNDIHSELRVHFTDAILGTFIPVRTVRGENKDICLPAGSQHKTRLTLHGEGMPIPGKATCGDHHFDVLLQIPRTVTEGEAQLLQKLQGLGARGALFEQSDS